MVSSTQKSKQPYFMLDIETMGTDKTSDDIIEIGILELNRDKHGFYQPGRTFSKVLCTDQKPKNDWIATTHKDLLRLAGTGKSPAPGLVRSHILEFFNECGVTELAQIMGMNVAGFDLPFMVQKGYLVPPQNGGVNNVTAGDYHYRVYELKGAFNVAQDVFGVDSKELFKRAERASPTTYLPANGRPHTALYDCYKQLNTLNGVIALLRQGCFQLSA